MVALLILKIIFNYKTRSRYVKGDARQALDVRRQIGGIISVFLGYNLENREK